MMVINKIFGKQKNKNNDFSMGYPYEKENKHKFNSGKFIKSAHHKTKPKYIDDETWWVPDKSGPITKGYFAGYTYDKKRKVILDGNRIIQKV